MTEDILAQSITQIGKRGLIARKEIKTFWDIRIDWILIVLSQRKRAWHLSLNALSFNQFLLGELWPCHLPNHLHLTFRDPQLWVAVYDWRWLCRPNRIYDFLFVPVVHQVHRAAIHWRCPMRHSPFERRCRYRRFLKLLAEWHIDFCRLILFLFIYQILSRLHFVVVINVWLTVMVLCVCLLGYTLFNFGHVSMTLALLTVHCSSRRTNPNIVHDRALLPTSFRSASSHTKLFYFHFKIWETQSDHPQ